MSVYQTMWNDFKNQVSVSIAKRIPIEDILQRMDNFEKHYNDEIMRETVEAETELKAIAAKEEG